MADFSITSYTTSYLDIATLFSGTGWELVGTSLRHSSSKTTTVSKTYDLEIGRTYQVSFTITNYQSCNVKIQIGDYISPEYNTDGVHTFTTPLTGSSVITFIGNGYFDITNFNIYTEIPTFSVVTYTDTDVFEDKSFTVSFNPLKEQWISYHDYIPKIYIPHSNNYLVVEDNINIKSGHGENYRDRFILETVFNDNPLYTKVFNSLQINSEAFEDDKHVNQFFDDLIVYNDDQISGIIPLNSTNLTRKERDWNINKFADISNNSGKLNLFNTDWQYKKDNYYIDKVINDSAINVNKEWYKRGRFRNKYLIARFISNSLDNTKIIINFVNTIYRLSQR